MTPGGDEAARFQTLAAALGDAELRRFRLAERADYLRALPAGAFRRSVAAAPWAPLDPDTLNQLAGAIELAAERRGQAPPAWTYAVRPSPTPISASDVASVRLHLLTRTPVALRRRNLFADASFEDRV